MCGMLVFEEENFVPTEPSAFSVMHVRLVISQIYKWWQFHVSGSSNLQLICNSISR